MRKNRRDPKDRTADAAWANPSTFTRAARRSVGYRKPVSLIGPEHEGLVVNVETVLPRYARRHGIEAMTGEHSRRRIRKMRARLGRSLAPHGMVPA